MAESFILLPGRIDGRRNDGAAAEIFGQKTAAAPLGEAVTSPKQAPALPPSSALPSAPHALVESLVNEDAETEAGPHASNYYFQLDLSIFEVSSVSGVTQLNWL